MTPTLTVQPPIRMYHIVHVPLRVMLIMLFAIHLAAITIIVVVSVAVVLLCGTVGIIIILCAAIIYKIVVKKKVCHACTFADISFIIAVFILTHAFVYSDMKVAEEDVSTKFEMSEQQSKK